MSEQDNVGIVQQAYACFQKGDIPGLLGLMAQDVEWRLPVVENIAFTGARQGRDEVAQFFTTLDAEEEFTRFEPQEYITQGDQVVVLGLYAGRVKSTGREYTSDWVHIFTVRNGQIMKFREMLDTAAMASAFQKARSAE